MNNLMTCPSCGSEKVAPTKGNGVGNTMDCLVCGRDFTPSPMVAEPTRYRVVRSPGVEPRLEILTAEPSNASKEATYTGPFCPHCGFKLNDLIARLAAETGEQGD